MSTKLWEEIQQFKARRNALSNVLTRKASSKHLYAPPAYIAPKNH
jgi:hypothetical protein